MRSFVLDEELNIGLRILSLKWHMSVTAVVSKCIQGMLITDTERAGAGEKQPNVKVAPAVKD